MIFLIIFIIVLYIYNIYYIKNNIDNCKKLKIICTVLSICALGLGLYYDMCNYDNSITYYILKILNISY